MRKYTYHDWLEGKLILNYDCYIPSGKKPTLVMWDDFNDEDVLLIKEKQQEIFDERVISLLEKYKSAFQKDISASLDIEGLCNHTVNGITSILTDEMPIGWKSEEVIRTELWDIGFTGDYLYGIKKAYKYGIMKGELHYDFINSPNRDYQSPAENPQIYVRSMSSFKIWIESLSFQQAETQTNKLKVKQIALIHFYENLQITRENAGSIADKYGYTAKTSGEGLFQDYTIYCSVSNRKGRPIPCTPIRLKNKIELFQSVVNHLSDINKLRAIDEIEILKTIFESEYR